MYVLQKDDKIKGYSTSQVNESYVWTDEDIVEVGNEMFFASQIVEIEKARLDMAKENKINELKVARDAKEIKPVQTDKGLFDYDDKSRDRLAIARQALTDTGGGEITWTTADNQRVNLAITDFAQINSVAAQRSNSLHVLYNEMKEQVNDCETVEEVEAIHWPVEEE